MRLVSKYSFRFLFVLKLALIVIIILFISGAFSPSLIRFIGPTFFTNATFIMPCDRRSVGLSIDDGPDPVSTPLILDVLKEHGVTATFFIVGVRGEAHKALLKRIVDEGHELANHSYTETVTLALNEHELKASIAKTHTLLSEFQTIRWFRPGTAFYNREVVKAIKPYEYQIVIGDVYPFDTLFSSSQFHSWYISTTVQPGSIIIMHDARERGPITARTLAMVLPQLKAMGYQLMSLEKLQSECEVNT